MKLTHIVFSLLLVSLAWTGCKKDEVSNPEPTPTTEILPGVGITEFKIGDAAQVVVDLYGTPFPSYGFANGIYTHTLYYSSKGIQVYCEPTTEDTFNPQMKIVSIRLFRPYAGKTNKGIGVGSNKADVKAAYGDPISSSMNFIDKYTGMRVGYDGSSDIVGSIEVE
jgi:hypothetical protein